MDQLDDSKDHNNKGCEIFRDYKDVFFFIN